MTLADGIPWAIAVFGWAATHIFSKARERRKEFRSQIDKLHEHIISIEKDSRSFHCGATFDEIKAGDLVAKIGLLERLIMRIPILNIDNLHPHIIGVRRAVTLVNFDKSTFASQAAYGEIVQEVSAASQDLEDEIERQYRARYTHKFPYIRIRS